MQIKINSRSMLIPPLQSEVEAELVELMSYKYRKYIRGKDAWAKFGKAAGNEITLRTFLLKDVASSWMACPAGFIDSVSEILYKYGYQHSFYFDGFTDCVPDWEHVKGKVQFRPTQEDNLRRLLQFPFGGIEASPGYGKSFLIYVMCELFHKYKIDITTDSVQVCRTLEEYLAPYIPDLGFVGDGDKRVGRVTIYTTDSLHRSDGSADILIGDEVHAIVTEKASPKFGIYKKARRYWFSATPDARADNSSIRVEALFGKARAYISYQDCVRLGLIANLEVNWLPFFMDFDPTDGFDDPTKEARFGIWRNRKRNLFIAEHCNNTVPKDEQLLILVNTVEHLAHLSHCLPDYEVAFGAGKDTLKEAKGWVDAGLLPSRVLDRRKEQNATLRKAFTAGELQRIIVTSIWDTGVNFPNLTNIFRTDPFDAGAIKDVQAPGRASRIIMANGQVKELGRLYNLVDMFNKSIYSKASRTRTNYRSQGWEEIGWLTWDQQ